MLCEGGIEYCGVDNMVYGCYYYVDWFVDILI